MKGILATCCLCFALHTAPAAIILFDLSPAGTDGAIGISGLNETPPNASTGSGNEIGDGISYDTDSNILTLNLAYGASKGFSDLTSDWNGGLHLHSGPIGGPAGSVVIDLAPIHVSDGLRAGEVSGTRTVDASLEDDLLGNLLYVNIHSGAFPGGEIRGQLVVVPEPRHVTFAAGLALFGFLAARHYSQRKPVPGIRSGGQ